MRARALLVTIAMVLSLAVGAAVAQETVLTNEPDQVTDPGSPPDAWATRCASTARKGPLACTTSQRLRTKDTNQLLGSVTVQIEGDGKPVLVVSLPLGLSIPGGVSVDVDGAGQDQLALQACDRTGCFASAPISDGLLKSLQGGKVLSIKFLSLSKQPVTLQFTLVGFGAAYQKIA